MKLSHASASKIRVILIFIIEIISFPVKIIYLSVEAIENFIDDWLFWKLQGKPTKYEERANQFFDSKTITRSKSEDAF